MMADSNMTTLVGGQRILCHPAYQCMGDSCCVHSPSAHHMVTWPQNWRGDRQMMERICPHGIGHPDPDDLIGDDLVHGCDGCCVDRDWAGELRDTLLRVRAKASEL